MEGRKQRNLGSMANLARERTKYDLGSRELRGHFRREARSMGPPCRASLLELIFLEVTVFVDNHPAPQDSLLLSMALKGNG